MSSRPPVPKAPSLIAGIRVANQRRFSRADAFAFGLLTCLSVTAFTAFTWAWVRNGDWFGHPGTLLVLSFIVFFKIANSQAKWVALPFMSVPTPLTLRAGLKVAVVTTIVPGTESLEMLEETVQALAALDYPHDTWVLDEGDDPDVQALCQRTGAQHFSRRHLPHYQAASGTYKVRSKHGNYNAWLHAVGFERYAIVAAFDPDHVPVPSFLTQVLGHFEDSRVGYVQVAQAYYNQAASFIARGAAEETYEYYSCTQMAAYGLGQPAVVGCHNTHRVEALKEVGGFAAHDADDLLIGRRYQAHGWRGVYVPRILARGLAPVDWNAYLTQQLRWARSVADVTYRRRHLLGHDLSPVARGLSVLHTLFYLQNSVTAFVSLVLLVYMVTSGNVPSVVSYASLPSLALVCATLQLCEFYRQRFYLDPQSEQGIHWRASLLRYAKWPVFILALWDVALNRDIPYALTRKVRIESRSRLLLVPHLLVILSVCAALVAGHVLGRSLPSLLYWVAAAMGMVSLALIMTDWLRFPAPFDKMLLRSRQYGGAAVLNDLN